MGMSWRDPGGVDTVLTPSPTLQVMPGKIPSCLGPLASSPRTSGLDATLSLSSWELGGAPWEAAARHLVQHLTGLPHFPWFSASPPRSYMG